MGVMLKNCAVMFRAGWKGCWVGGSGRVGDCYANAICSSFSHCSPGIHKHDGRNGGDDDARCELV